MKIEEVERIARNLLEVNQRIAEAAGQTNRQPTEITLVTVSKTFPIEIVKSAVAAGAKILGESRVQEGSEKVIELGDIASWHLIGHLQTNKAAQAVLYFDMIQSIDSLHLADKISQAAVKVNKKIDCLLEINSSGEETKYGFSPDDLIDAAERIEPLPGINMKGLMTIGPWTNDASEIQKAFEITHKLYEMMKTKIGSHIDTLSMGMSSDYELAIHCGSNMVRVGSAIFGERAS
ncbi:MAG: YggS family pyridoxal phosphate-dependent enzyme [Candidatus Zixiibacteriota bacterium]